MKPSLPVLAAAWLLVAPSMAGQTSVTIYNDGRVLQRRTLPLSVPAGFSSHRVPLGGLDLSSLFATDSGVAVTGVVYDALLDEGNAVRRSVGQRLEFATRGANGVREVVAADVLGSDPERFRTADGRVTFQRPGSPLFPAELVPAQPVIQVGIRSDRARTSLGLGFFSGGASWNAAYTVVLGRAGTARIAGQATIAAGTLKADSVEVQLVAGTVSRAVPDQLMMKGRAARTAPMVAEAAAAQQTIGEAQLYTLPGRLSFVPGLETAAMLFDPTTAGYERTFTVSGQLPYWGELPQYGEEQTEPVQVTYVVRRPLKTEFGDRPVPGGVARVYDRDQGGRLQLVAETNLAHTAAGQDLRLDAGTAFDLTAKKVQSTYETRREGQRTIAFASYTVTLSNAKDSAATVEVIERRGGEWAVLSSSIAAEKLSSTATRFRVRVPAKGDATLTYRVRVVW